MIKLLYHFFLNEFLAVKQGLAVFWVHKYIIHLYIDLIKLLYSCFGFASALYKKQKSCWISFSKLSDVFTACNCASAFGNHCSNCSGDDILIYFPWVDVIGVIPSVNGGGVGIYGDDGINAFLKIIICISHWKHFSFWSINKHLSSLENFIYTFISKCFFFLMHVSSWFGRAVIMINSIF